MASKERDNFIARAIAAKDKVGNKLEAFGGSLRKSYDQSLAEWKASPRYKEGQKRALYEGGGGRTR